MIRPAAELLAELLVGLLHAAGSWAAAAAIIIAACATIASGVVSAEAQGVGGGRGGRGNDNNSPINAPDPHVVAMAKLVQADPEDPIPMILADKNEIKLSDSQTVVLSVLESKLRHDNTPLRNTLDSLRPPGVNSKPDYAHLDAAGRDSLVKARAAIAQTMGAIHDNDLKARTDAFEALNNDQRNAITDLERKVRTMLNTGIPADDDAGKPKHHSSGSG